jgi:hypothetical protein
MRTSSEMQDIYVELGEIASRELYTVSNHTDMQWLDFVGTRHSNDVDDPQWHNIDDVWRPFLAHKNPKKVVFTEGHTDFGGWETAEQAILEGSDPGYTAWLAHEAEVELVSPEPDRTEEINAVRAMGFSLNEIIVYYFARQMNQWVTRDHLSNPGWEAYATRLLENYQAVHDWDGETLELDLVLKQYEQVAGKPFDIEDKLGLNKLSDPSYNPVSDASGRFRDGVILDAVKAKWAEGYDIFAVFGSGHAIVLEPVLKSLTPDSDGE